MKVIVYLEVPYEVEVETYSVEIAERAVEANWSTVYKHQAKAVDFPPNLSAKVLRVEAKR